MANSSIEGMAIKSESEPLVGITKTTIIIALLGQTYLITCIKGICMLNCTVLLEHH